MNILFLLVPYGSTIISILFLLVPSGYTTIKTKIPKEMTTNGSSRVVWYKVPLRSKG